MKRSGLFLLTVLTVLVTGFVLAQGRPRAHASRPSGLRRPALGHLLRPDAASDAAARYRNCQASHWRACLLQR